jgi:hypothetical protein
MRSTYAIMTLGLLTAAPALAQPTLPPTAPPGTLPDDPEEPPPAVVAPTAEPVAVTTTTTTVSSPSMTSAPAQPAPQRPDAFAIALGLGYVIPGDLSTPNTTSARIRLVSGLTFEPQIVLGNETRTTDDGTTSIELSSNEISIQLGVRYPLIKHNKVDFSLLGSAGVNVVTIDPDGDDNDRQATTFSLGWGIGLDYWVNHHWNVSFSATNPIVQTSSIEIDQGPGTTSEDSSVLFGAIFDPTLAVMLHLYL